MVLAEGLCGRVVTRTDPACPHRVLPAATGLRPLQGQENRPGPGLEQER